MSPGLVMQTIGEEGIALIKFFEGCKLSSYTCPGGVLTIGYGETGKHVVPGLRLANEQEADTTVTCTLSQRI